MPSLTSQLLSRGARGSDRVVGLDLGSSGIKAVQVLRLADGTFIVEKQAARTLPGGVVFDGRIAEGEHPRVSETLRALWAEAGFDTKDVIYGLNSSSSVFMQEIFTPILRPEDAPKALPAIIQAQAAAPNPDDYQFSWTIVGEIFDEHGERRLRVLVYSVLNAYTSELANVIHDAGLRVVGADLNALAGLRAIHVTEQPDRHLDAVVDIGACVTSVLLHHNGVPKLLTLDPDSAGMVATSKIAAALGKDEFAEWENLEWHKKNDDSPVGLIAQARADYSRTLSAKLATNLSSFFANSEEFDGIANLTLVGGGALLHGLQHSLRENLGDVPLSYARVAENITGIGGTPVDRHENRTGGDYLVAIGLGTGTRI